MESNRLYESLEGGCVPVVIAEYGPGEEAVGTAPSVGAEAVAATRAAFSPLGNVTGEPPPFVAVTYEHELPDALAPLLSSPEMLDALQARSLAWWRASKRHYAAAFEQVVCPWSKSK